MKWDETAVYQALSSLELNRRLISIALDGTLGLPCDDDDTSQGSTLNVDDHHYFTRCIVWRIFLNVLTVPFAGTSIDNIVSSWCPRLYTLRAHYATQKQQFHECYKCFERVDEICAAIDESQEIPEESIPREGLRGSVALSRLMLNMSCAANARRPSIGKGKSPLESCGPLVSEDIVALDIRRTYLNNDPQVPHHMLFNILTVWRWQHPVVGYHQGMHEIAGYCLQLLARAAMGLPDDCPQEVAECANAAFREADAYFLFDGIMSTFGLGELFHATTVVGTPHQRSSVNFSVFTQVNDTESIPERPAMTALENVCEHVAFHLLRDHSSTLYHHLANTGMFDKLLVFLPRWIRNMFTRELTTPQLMVVWDGVFAVFYHEEVERMNRRKASTDSSFTDGKKTLSGRLFRSDSKLSEGSPVTSSSRSGATEIIPTVYAGSPAERGGPRRSNAQGPPPFSRTVLGVVVAILLHLEDDLLHLEDDFSLLRRLTATPILSPMVDPLWLMNTAMAIANSRPPGVIPIHRRRESLNGTTSDETEGWSKAAAAAAATRLTKEELMLQQRSVALVVERVTHRIADALKIDMRHMPSDAAGDGGIKLSSSDVSLVRGALRELQCVADRLSFL